MLTNRTPVHRMVFPQCHCPEGRARRSGICGTTAHARRKRQGTAVYVRHRGCGPTASAGQLRRPRPRAGAKRHAKQQLLSTAPQYVGHHNSPPLSSLPNRSVSDCLRLQRRDSFDMRTSTLVRVKTADVDAHRLPKKMLTRPRPGNCSAAGTLTPQSRFRKTRRPTPFTIHSRNERSGTPADDR